MKTKYRRFVHTTGFGDDTEYLEYREPRNIWLKPFDKKAHRVTHFTLKEMLKFVKQGYWKEL